MNFFMKTMKRLFVYKCKLSLALLYLADIFINNFKTKLNVFVFTEEFQIEKVFTIPLEESFIYWQENMKAIWSVGHQSFSHWHQ